MFARRWVQGVMSRGFMSALGMYFHGLGFLLSFLHLSEGAGLGVSCFDFFSLGLVATQMVLLAMPWPCAVMFFLSSAYGKCPYPRSV